MHTEHTGTELESYAEAFSEYVNTIQEEVCLALEHVDGHAQFQQEVWERPGGGGGRTRVLAEGQVFEKAGVSTSAVFGPMPLALQQHLNTPAVWFFATGISMVIHPRNPFVPTTHANYRYFELREDERSPVRDAWFGGGADLTPYYLFEADATHFHDALRAALDPFGPDLYPTFKAQCDHYFRNSHRNEGRGIGGTFYDHCRATPERPLAFWHDVNRAAAKSFLPAYLPVVQRRLHTPFGPQHRQWQEIRRGRYVEFNLLHDKGTHFGLKSNGRTESILMSLPPVVRWAYMHEPAPGSPEALLLEVLQHPRWWATEPA